MNRMIVSQTGVGASQMVPVSPQTVPCHIGFGCVVSGTVTYTVQHTFDNVFDPTVTPTWFPHPFVAAESASDDGNYAYPIAATRVNVTAGTGTVTMTVLQGVGT